MTRATVLVTGASGQIGYSVLQLCASREIPVLAVSRRPHSDPPAGSQVRWLQNDLALSPKMDVAPESLVHAAPLGLASSLVTELPGLKNAVAFSSTSVLVKHDSPDPREQSVVAQLLQAEAEFARACEDKDVDWTILRPTLIYGHGLDQNLTRVARWAENRTFFPLVLGGSGLRQPVHAGDLADATLAALERPSASGGTYVLAGGTTLSFRDMVAEVYRTLDRTPRFVPLPAWLLVGLLRSFGGRQIPWAMAARMGQDLVFDDRPARADLGYEPRPFRPDAATWRPPMAHSA